MKKMNRKGFTLIELLTVIAILAVILLIAAPTILGVLDKARKNTFKNQVLLYVESVKTQIALKQMGAGYTDVTVGDSTSTGAQLKCSVDSTSNKETCTIDITEVPMESDTLTGGTITVEIDTDGKATYYVTAVKNDTYSTPTAKTDVSALDIDDITKADTNK